MTILLLTFLLGMIAGTVAGYWTLGVRFERHERAYDTVYQLAVPGQVLTSVTRKKRV